MTKKVYLGHSSFVLAFVTILFLAGAVSAQTKSFTYQGKLTDSGSPANGAYDMQFTLCDAATLGNCLPPITKSAVTVTNGSFTVVLDYGADPFSGADRFLQISVSPAGAGTYSVLSPRRQITSTPYAIRALNCTNCIQNSTIQQPNSNFNISGNGTVGGSLFAGSINTAGSITAGGSLFTGGPISAGSFSISTTGPVSANNFFTTGSPNLGGSNFGGTVSAGEGDFTFLHVIGNGSGNALLVEKGLFQATGDAFVKGNLSTGSTVTVGSFPPGPNAPVCSNNGVLSTCSSSLRYKKDLARFAGGLNIVNRLRPISFTWRDHPERDFGLAAEEVAAVEPLLVTRNAAGEIEGVKYSQLSAVFINAFKEQQAQIKKQQEQIGQQQLVIRKQQEQARQQQDQIAALQTASAALNARLKVMEKTLRKKPGHARSHR